MTAQPQTPERFVDGGNGGESGVYDGNVNAAGIGKSRGGGYGNIGNNNNIHSNNGVNNADGYGGINNGNNAGKNAVVNNGAGNDNVNAETGRAGKTGAGKKPAANIDEAVKKEPIIQAILEIFDGEILK